MTQTTTIEVKGTARGPVAVIPPQRLRILEGPGAGTVFDAKSDRIVIGTDPKADVVLGDRTVSGFHCEVGLEDGGTRVVVRDLGSRNGTWLVGTSTLRILSATSSVPVRLRLGALEVDVEDAGQKHSSAEVRVEPIAGLVAVAPASLEVVRTIRLLAPTSLSTRSK